MKNVKNQKIQDIILNRMKKTEARCPFTHYKMYASVKLESVVKVKTILQMGEINPNKIDV